MPYNSGTGAYERRSTTVIDASPDGDTVYIAIDAKLDQAADDTVTDLNHHKTNGNHYPATSVTADSRFLRQSPAGVVTWADGIVAADAALKDMSNVASGAIAPEKIAQDANNRFSTDAEKSTWNGALYTKEDVEGVLAGSNITSHGHSAEIASAFGKGFSAYKSADQTGIAPSTATKVTFNTEEWDTGGWYDPATSRFTPPAGKYLVNICLFYSAGIPDIADTRAFLYKNGSSVLQSINLSSGTSAQRSLCAIVDADGDDYFEVYALAGNTGTKTISGDKELTFFQACKI